MPRETKEQRLTRELSEMNDRYRNASQAITAACMARDKARSDMAKIENDVIALNGEVQSWKSHASAIEEAGKRKNRKMLEIIFDLSLKVARHEGYIARVTDLDTVSDIKSGPAEDVDITSLQRDIVGASSEALRDRILDSIDTDTLHQVLGRPPEEDRFLRRDG